MPIAMDKDVQFPYVLITDRGKDADKLPTFYFGALTMRAWRRLNVDAQKIDDCKTVEDALTELCRMICKHLVGWKNMTNPDTSKALKFNKKRIEDLITMDEGWELIRGIKNQGVEVDDQKN